MLYPTRASQRRGVRAWLHTHLTEPLDRLYEHLDANQQDDEQH